MKPTNINRRNFIKKSGMLLAATSVPSFLQAGEKQPTLSIKNQKIAIDSQWDVIVVGGGPAGCTAATAAAREGAKTLLIEATGQLGGMGTTGMIPAWCPFSDGEKIIYRGLAEKVFRAAKKGVPHEPADKLDWVSINPEQLMTVYDDMVCSKLELALFSVRWIQEFLIVRWLENGKKLSMQDVEELSWRYAREIEHSDDNLNALEDWLFGMYAPEGCQLA